MLHKMNVSNPSLTKDFNLINKTIKNLFVLGMLIAIGSYNPKVKAGLGEALVAGGAIAGASVLSYIGFSIYSNHIYNQTILRHKILKKFYDKTDYTYENLKQDALQQYYNNCASSNSLENDYPLVWLEKDTTAKKNFLAWMFLSVKMQKLSKELEPALNYLRKNPRFQAERKEFNKELRQKEYRDEKLRLEREKLLAQRMDRLNRNKDDHNNY